MMRSRSQSRSGCTPRVCTSQFLQHACDKIYQHAMRSVGFRQLQVIFSSPAFGAKQHRPKTTDAKPLLYLAYQIPTSSCHVTENTQTISPLEPSTLWVETGVRNVTYRSQWPEYGRLEFHGTPYGMTRPKNGSFCFVLN
jgi:hypothetical protein